jgi:hypothetical protein
VLYPPSNCTEDATTEEQTVTVSADGVATEATPTARMTNSGSGASGSSAQAGISTAESSAANGSSGVPPSASGDGPTAGAGKDGIPFIPPGQTFEFALKMPSHHYRDSNVDLPPTCSIFQVGMQASVEYVLRIKLSRKGWRLNET